MVSREVRERTVKNLSVLKLKNEETYKRALTLVNQSEVRLNYYYSTKKLNIL